MTDVAVPGVTFGRIEHGRAIVDCPACPSALWLSPDVRLFRCWECNAGADIVWPDNIDDIIRILALRPLAINRGWVPGETLMDLVNENLRHGIGPRPDQLQGHLGPLLVVNDDRIVAGVPALGAA